MEKILFIILIYERGDGGTETAGDLLRTSQPVRKGGAAAKAVEPQSLVLFHMQYSTM